MDFYDQSLLRCLVSSSFSLLIYSLRCICELRAQRMATLKHQKFHFNVAEYQNEHAEDLLGVQTPLIASIRPTRREVPKELGHNRWSSEQSSIFCFDRQLTLPSYVPIKGRAVILFSSMHHNQAVDDDQQEKPESVFDYNDTEGGVD